MTEVHKACSSPFLAPGSSAKSNALAFLHLKRDHQIPVILHERDELDEGYDEGKVTNTRFGSFPHSTLIDVPWGSQVRASVVDTGSRGRRGLLEKTNKGQKRKRGPGTPDYATSNVAQSEREVALKAAVVASTGFIHLLPPTPESWTASLPHRTQVVYTPDYSYILQRLRVRPGTIIIEAGAGSGSFTHAAARAVFDGCRTSTQLEAGPNGSESRGRGKVWSFEFHEQRVKTLRAEIQEHGLEGVVEVTQRDVCQDGFMPSNDISLETALEAQAVFLDLPAPWLALKHLRRGLSDSDLVKTANQNGSEACSASKMTVSLKANSTTTKPGSPLSPQTPVRLCTFSPCIEQVQRTVSTLRQSGWIDIEMVEIAAKRIEVRRERVGLQEEGLRGVNASPASVDEAVARLREVESRFTMFHEDASPIQSPSKTVESDKQVGINSNMTKQQRLEGIRDALADRKLYKEGRLIHRSEPDLKTHTSYLVFAILPRDWTAEDEENAQHQWPSKVTVIENGDRNLSKRKMKKAAKAASGDTRGQEASEE
ncbi:tRNA (adenine-N(1)-)-methyltransferase catalytic subunit trm61 [Schaereria dolodes]|nr:tRNA (adenine-N(1)-)-methyltransferase catalytic subunit trm61 [Schaereria dolodes]